MDKTTPNPNENSLNPDFYFSMSRTAVLEAMLKLPSARITDIANLAEKDAGTVSKVLAQCRSRKIVQKLEGTELYQLNPKLRKHVEFLCREFRAILSYSPENNRIEATKHGEPTTTS